MTLHGVRHIFKLPVNREGVFFFFLARCLAVIYAFNWKTKEPADMENLNRCAGCCTHCAAVVSSSEDHYEFYYFGALKLP